MNKNWFLSGFSIFCWEIPGINRHIKKEMTTIQTNLSWKLPNMDPSFFESFWIWTSRIPTSVHLVHCPKNHLQIILLYILKKSQILSIKLPISNLLCCKSIRRNTDMINPIFSKLLFYLFQFSRDIPLIPRIIDKRHHRQKNSEFFLYLHNIFNWIIERLESK